MAPDPRSKTVKKALTSRASKRITSRSSAKRKAVDLTALVERIHTLPSLPEVAIKLGRLVNDPAVTASDVAAVVEQDPAISAKVLRIVNGPIYGRSVPVRDLREAVALLGLKTLRSLVTSISVIESCSASTAAFNMRAFWTHSVACAALCRSICARTKGGDPELYYLIGLMRGIGRIVLAQNLPAEVKAIVAVAKEFTLPFHAAAREVIHADDADVGSWLIGQWGLEQAVIDGIAGQYGGGKADPYLVSLLALVDFLCYRKGIPASGDYHAPEASPSDIRRLRLDAAGLQAVLAGLEEEVQKAKALLSGA
jgi:HD-like signal output (HDOD) protein